MKIYRNCSRITKKNLQINSWISNVSPQVNVASALIEQQHQTLWPAVQKGLNLMRERESIFRSFATLVVHAISDAVVLIVWMTMAWLVDKLLTSEFPLQGMSLISFRILEVAFHIKTLHLVYKLMFARAKENTSWWK